MTAFREELQSSFILSLIHILGPVYLRFGRLAVPVINDNPEYKFEIGKGVELRKGKGVSYMEGQVGWHGKAPNDEEYAIAMEELGKAGEALCQK